MLFLQAIFIFISHSMQNPELVYRQNSSEDYVSSVLKKAYHMLTSSKLGLSHFCLELFVQVFQMNTAYFCMTKYAALIWKIWTSLRHKSLSPSRFPSSSSIISPFLVQRLPDCSARSSWSWIQPGPSASTYTKSRPTESLQDIFQCHELLVLVDNLFCLGRGHSHWIWATLLK